MSNLKLSEVVMRLAVLSGVSLVLALGALPAGAQTVIGAKSGVINYVEGDAFLGDTPYVMQPSQFGEVKEKMVFRTEEGRAEVLLPPGVFFRMGENTSFRMISNRLVDTRVELLTGSAVIEIDDIDKEAAVTVVCKNATITLAKAGIYRFNAEPALVRVQKGGAEVAINGQTTSVGAGKMMTLGAVASVEKFNSADTDSLDRWSSRRAEVVANANISAAKQAHYGGYGGGYGSSGAYGIGANPCRGYGGYNTGPIVHRAMGTWQYNPWYGFGTYIPCNGSLNSPYGYRYFSPYDVYRAFYAPRPVFNPAPDMGTFSRPTYNTMGTSSGGYSGTMSSAPSVSTSAPAAASSGSSAASSAGSSSVGHGSAGGGARGK
jgi:hypothetical protein